MAIVHLSFTCHVYILTQYYLLQKKRTKETSLTWHIYMFWWRVFRGNLKYFLQLRTITVLKISKLKSRLIFDYFRMCLCMNSFHIWLCPYWLFSLLDVNVQNKEKNNPLQAFGGISHNKLPSCNRIQWNLSRNSKCNTRDKTMNHPVL